MDGHKNTSTPAPPESSVPDLPRRAPLQLNPDDFAEEMKDFDLDEDQAHEFLQIIWGILVICSDYEMSVDPVSLICGQNASSPDPAPSGEAGVVKSFNRAKTNNNEKEEL